MRAVIASMALVALGCGSTVTLPGESTTGEGGSGVAGGGATSSAGGGEPCVGPPQLDFRTPGAPTLQIARVLHVNGTLEGQEGYYLTRMHGGDFWFRDLEVSELTGSAGWRGWAGMAQARVRGGDGVEPLAIDRMSPGQEVGGEYDVFAPYVNATYAEAGLVPEAYRGTMGRTSNDGIWLFFCHQSTAAEPPKLVRKLHGVDEPLVEAQHNACSPHADGSVAAGDLFVSWWTQGATNTVNIADVHADGALTVSFSFANDGIHAYGAIEAAATDGRVTVVNVANEGWMLAFGPDGEIAPEGPYVAFDGPGPKRLLAVVHAVAYFATPAGVVGYDFSDLSSPEKLANEAAAPWDPTTVRFLAHEAFGEAATIHQERIFVRDAEGLVHGVPLTLESDVLPARAYLGDPFAGGPEPCPR